jgi:single-strand DNA-binding protein
MSGSSLNRVTLIGHLGADPEVRSLRDGSTIVTFSLATSERWKDRNSGETREQTEWHRIVIFNPGLAKLAEQYLQRGSRILIEGKLRTNKWQDQSGQDRYTTEIAVTPYNGLLTFLDGRRNDAEATRGGPGGSDAENDIPY